MENTTIDWTKTKTNAIQQLAMEIEEKQLLPFDPLTAQGSEVISIFDKAMETFKTQIIEAYNHGHRDLVQPRGESYYAETFENDGSNIKATE